MDLEDLDSVKGSNEGFQVELYHPGTMKNLGIFITVLGRDSAEYNDKLSDQNRRRASKMFRGGASAFARNMLTKEELDQDTIEILASCTKGWRQVEADKDDPDVEHSKPTITVGGEELTCTPANVTKVYRDYPWIREQVDLAVSDRANFMSR